MFAHSVDQLLPKRFAALFVNRLVAHDSELVGARRHENKHSIAPRRFMHSEPMKFLLCGDQRIDIQLAALNENANLARRFRLRVANRLHNPIVLEFAQKFFGSHLSLPARASSAATKTSAAAAKSAE